MVFPNHPIFSMNRIFFDEQQLFVLKIMVCNAAIFSYLSHHIMLFKSNYEQNKSYLNVQNQRDPSNGLRPLLAFFRSGELDPTALAGVSLRLTLVVGHLGVLCILSTAPHFGYFI